MRTGSRSSEGSDDDRDKLETRVLQPGETAKVDLNLSEGVYKLECNVEGHDDMGMEMLFEVEKERRWSRRRAGRPRARGKEVVVDVRGLPEPATLEATVGQKITWTNHDPAEHTVTQEGGGFDSGTMAAELPSFTQAFDRPGEYRYISAALHPG